MLAASEVSSKVKDLVSENKSLKKGKKTKRKLVDLKEAIIRLNNFDLSSLRGRTQNIQDLRQLVDHAKKEQQQRVYINCESPRLQSVLWSAG